MMCEAFARLAVFHPLGEYLYVGMGSPFFSDFTLLHRQLGVQRLVSMERATESAERFRFNLPFDCVRLLLGESRDLLPTVELRQRAIVWLDFDGRLTKSTLDDWEFVLSSVPAGSMVVISVNAHPILTKEPTPDIAKIRLQDLSDTIGRERIPIDVVGRNLANWGTADVFYRILRESADTVLADRSSSSRLNFRQVFHFRYEDGAKMLTMGGLVSGEEEEELLAAAAFDRLPCYRPGPDPFRIAVPSLTFREMRYLDQFLPDRLDALSDRIKAGLLPEGDVRDYAAIYRYFPVFAETDL